MANNQQVESALSPIARRIGQKFDSLAVRKIEVPEWGDEDGPLFIYSTAMTLAEKRSIYAAPNADDYSVLADIVIRKALDENGERMFSPADKPILLNKAESDVLARVAQQIMGIRKAEEVEKNWKATSS